MTAQQIHTGNDDYAFRAEPILRSSLEVARENYTWAIITGENETACHEALRLAEQTDADVMTKKLGWHQRMLAEYEAAGDTFNCKEHRAGIADCEAALVRLAPAMNLQAAA